MAVLQFAFPFDVSYLMGNMLSSWLYSPIRSMANSVGALAVPSLVDANLNYAMRVRR